MGDKRFDVEKLIRCETIRGEKRYRVKWKDYSIKQATWELANALPPRIIQEYNGKHLPAKKPLVTDNILKLCDKPRELKQRKNPTEGAKLYREANQQVKKKAWEKQRRHRLKNNSKVSKKTCRKTTARKPTNLWKLETRENFYRPGQSREMSHRRTRHSEEMDRVLLWIVYTHNDRRSQGARCLSTNQQWQRPNPAGSSWSRSKNQWIKASRQGWTTFHRSWSRQEERPWQIYSSSSATRSGRQESGQHFGLSPWS